MIALSKRIFTIAKTQSGRETAFIYISRGKILPKRFDDILSSLQEIQGYVRSLRGGSGNDNKVFPQIKVSQELGQTHSPDDKEVPIRAPPSVFQLTCGSGCRCEEARKKIGDTMKKNHPALQLILRRCIGGFSGEARRVSLYRWLW